jgi:hypothetical protein
MFNEKTSPDNLRKQPKIAAVSTKNHSEIQIAQDKRAAVTWQLHCAHLTSTAVCSRRGEKRESRASQKAGRGLGGEGNLHKTPVRPAAGVSDRLLRLKEAGHVPATT